jgi:iron complex outermembrane receptor protein
LPAVVRALAFPRPLAHSRNLVAHPAPKITPQSTNNCAAGGSDSGKHKWVRNFERRRGRFFQSAQSPGNLNSEKILSREIGYFGNFSKYGLMIDARIFDDSLTDLISEKLQLSSFLPTNNNSDHLSGAEFQANYEPSDRWMLFLAYSYLHSDGASTPLEQTQYANNTGAFGISHLMDNDWRASLAFYGSGSSTASQTFYGREDLTFSKTSVLGKNNRLMTSFIIRHLDNTTAQYYQDVGQTVESRYNRAMQYFATVKISF